MAPNNNGLILISSCKRQPLLFVIGAITYLNVFAGALPIYNGSSSGKQMFLLLAIS